MKATIFLLFLFTITAHAQTSSFTYQGRLNDSGVAFPTNGQYDFRFDLVDPANNPVGATQTLTGVQVTNGVFTVQLDFGSDPFLPGANRYLVIAVKRPADPTYVVLAPRQQLTSTPFAIQTLNAENLGGVPANEYINNSDKRLSDARDPLPNSPSYIRNSTAGQTADFKITGNGTIVGTASASVFDTSGEYRLNGSRVLDMDASGNLFVGQNSLVNTGLNNAFIGVNAGTANTTGGGNTFAGNAAGSANTTAFFNSYYGHFAGNAASGSDNSFFGAEAGRFSTGSKNSFFGRQSGSATTTGDSNSFFGYGTGFNNVSGATNSFFGSLAGVNNVDGTGNTFVGSNAGTGNGSGSNNTYLGKNAGDNGGNSHNNVTLIGADADINISSSLSFATAIGAGSSVLENNTIALGRIGGADTVQVYGKVRVNVLGAAGATQLCRNATGEIATCSSSLRYKTRVADFTGGLSTLMKLRPITFDWKETGIRDLGFGAEDVAHVEPLLVIQNEQGEVEGVKYDRVTTVLVNAVKEQQEQIAAQSREIAELRSIVCSIRPRAAVCRRHR